MRRSQYEALSCLFLSNAILVNEIRTTFPGLSFFDVRADRCCCPQILFPNNPAAASLAEPELRGYNLIARRAY